VKDVAFDQTELPLKAGGDAPPGHPVGVDHDRVPGRRLHPGRPGAGNLPGDEGGLDRGPASLVPPIAFLVAVRIIRTPPSRERPHAYHRSVGVAHLLAAVAPVVMGTLLIIDSSMSLITAEHPAICSVELFWLGWLMIGVMVLAGVPPVLLGRAKMKLAEDLHDKVLYADADMSKAD
jgi:hypothetical protein